MTGVNFRFNWRTRSFRMSGGTPEELTGAEACQAWMENALHIRRGRLEIMPARYGTSAQNMIGKRISPAYLRAELEREIRECAELCPDIESVSDFRMADDVLTFNVKCVDGADHVLQAEADIESYASDVEDTPDAPPPDSGDAAGGGGGTEPEDTPDELR